MAKIKNECNFPLPINLLNRRSIHLRPLEERSIDEEDLNAPDLKSKIKGKMVSSIPDQVIIPKHKIRKEEVEK